jgi:type II secretory pathway component PulF
MKTFVTRLHLPTPPITESVIFAGDLLATQAFWFSVIATVIVLPTAWSIAMRNERLAVTFERLLFRIPIAGRLLSLYVHMSLSRSLADLFQHVGNADEVLKLAGLTMRFRIYRNAVESVRMGMFAGLPLELAVAEQTAFDPLFVEYLSVGASSGNYSIPLQRAAARFNKEFRHGLGVAVKRIDPLITFSVLGATIVILLGLYAPYYVGLPLISDRIHNVNYTQTVERATSPTTTPPH